MTPAPDTTQRDVAVVVATHDRAARLERLLDALRAQTLPAARYEVVVVDDGSTDSTGEMLERAAGAGGLNLRILRREVAAGPATARQEGWHLAGAPVIAFTDDDCAPAEDWLEAGLASVRAHPGAFVQGRTIPDPREADRLGPFSRTFEAQELHPDFPTCNIFYPREVLERIGGFDTEGFARPAGEDTDLAWRAIKAGARPVFEAGALVRHAVEPVGPLGMLQSDRWTAGMLAYARHPEARRAFPLGVFWRRPVWLLVATASLLLPGRLAAFRVALAYPYLRDLWARGKTSGGGPLLAPYYLLSDLAEAYAIVRAAIRHRTLFL